MGGSGSGNRWRFGTKATCEGMKRIELSYLRKHGMLDAGRSGSLRWTYGGQASGNISYSTYSDCLVLTYRFKGQDDDDWTDVSERMPFTYTQQRLGGVRRWFCCKSCQRRCSILYGGKWFRCRKCHNLVYTTQNESPIYRGLTRAQKLRNRLGGLLSIDDPFPAKPKGMHRQTYSRLRIKGEAFENAVQSESVIYFQNMFANIKKSVPKP